jgi:hypothetical protein
LDLKIGEELKFSTSVWGTINVKKFPWLFEALGMWRYFAYSRFIKFSVAPESNRATALALFDLEWRKVRMVIDFLFDINTFEVWLCLISADLIKQG